MKKTTELVIQDKRINVSGSWLKTIRLADEWHDDLSDPASLLAEIRKAGVKGDLFTFWQRVPDAEPRFSYYYEIDPVAVMPISTYDNWLKKQINAKTRNLVVKAQKKGVVVRPAEFDATFIRGMMNIFNEAPVRQGMRFWHYGKDFDTVKKEFSQFLFREEIFGAYVEDELVGFIFLVDAKRFAMLGMIVSMIKHRDKSPNNALIAKAVEVCAERGVPFLTYAVWPRPGTLREFKKHNGFECVNSPRYYVPLTLKGEMALKLKLHKEPVDQLPEEMVTKLKAYRAQYYAWRYKHEAAPSVAETRS